MTTIREILEYFDELRGRLLPPNKLQFDHIWSISIFTSDGDFCNTFEKHLRLNGGCKWRFTTSLLENGLKSLKFVQKMGSSFSAKPCEEIQRKNNFLCFILFVCFSRCPTLFSKFESRIFTHGLR